MIKTRTRRVIQGADYSGQEPRMFSQLCNDEAMLGAYAEGKDLYVEIASIANHKPYKLCLEHFPKGCPIKKTEDGHWVYAPLKSGEEDGIETFDDLKRYLSPDFDPELYDYDKLADGDTDVYDDGKELRNQAKKILLGIMYGRGERSIAEQLKCSIEEARSIKERVYIAFVSIKPFEEWSKQRVRDYGFVTTLWGRKRRLPEYNLPPFETYYVEISDVIDDEHFTMKKLPGTVTPSEADYVIRKVSQAKWEEEDKLILKFAKEKGILVVDNRSKIAGAMRQIINSQVQGSAADMSKLALIKLMNDEELKKRLVKVIIPIHDEVLLETPLRYARFVKKRFAEDMNNAPKPKLTIPVSCDVVTAFGWYHDEINLDEELDGLVG